MNLRKITLLAILGFGGLTLGCSDKCKSSCDDLRKCPDPVIKADTDCDKFCDSLDKMADTASCDSQRDDLLDCEDKLSDKCTATTACSSQGEAWESCYGAYCTAHPGDATCTTFNGYLSVAVGAP